MTVDLKPLEDQVIVITGASSGIGLTTARMATDCGVRGLILISRSDDALHQLAEEINESDGPTQAIALACDVADNSALERATTVAVERFGGFDTWINNAGVSIYGRLRDVSEQDHRRLFETNFWGLVNGSQIAVEHLKNRGGSLINIGSTLSDRSIPIQGMYAASKHAVKGYTDALRMEIEEEELPISVTLIKPAAIDTPYTINAKNYMDDAPKNPPPVYAPELVAETILYAAENPVRDLFVGGGGKAFSLAEKYAPRLTDHLMENVTIAQMHSGKPRYDHDSLYTPSENLRQYGDYEGVVRQNSAYTTAVTNPAATSLAVLASIGAITAAAAVLFTTPKHHGHRFFK
jgi:NADP-dependent 3-hydroxy acid dehydrogenase YdfG